MGEAIKWLRKLYNKFLHSMGLIPALMGVGFLLLTLLTLELDEAGVGTRLNEQFKWLTLKDPAIASTIVSTVAAGIISLMALSFSMVMVIMNLAASQMSNRMLDIIIGDKVQKTILGFYVGTIVFALFLLTNISNEQDENSVPSLSVYVLLVFTIVDIFLFVFFLHHITQIFRYEQLIKKIHNRTANTMYELVNNKNSCNVSGLQDNAELILSDRDGYYQGFDETRLLKLAAKHDMVLEFLHPIGTHILKDTPLLQIKGSIQKEQIDQIFKEIDFYHGQEIDKNAYYGFLHLTEVAVKALSPAVNDPGTAVLSINALAELLSAILKHPIENALKDKEGKERIITRQLSFTELFEQAVEPIWDYGKNDRMVQRAFKRMLEQLALIAKDAAHIKFIKAKLKIVNEQPI